MDDAALAEVIVPPDVPAAAPSAASVALARRLSRGSPSRALQALTEGAIGEAVTIAASYADDAISAATRAAYLRDWAHFATWCRAKDADVAELPVNPVLVAAYLGALAPTHGASALRCRVAAIAYHHRRRGVPFLSNHPVIRETLGGIRRRHPRPVRPAAALTSPDIKQHPAQQARPGRQGADVTLPRMRGEDTCPVRAFEAWLAAAKIRRGPVFRGINRHGAIEARLTPGAVRLILLKRAEMAKLTVHASERLSPHGLRAGFITEAYLAGAPDEQVGAHVRHDDLRSTRLEAVLVFHSRGRYRPILLHRPRRLDPDRVAR